VSTVSAQDSWGETDIQSINNNQITFDQTKDLPGPITLAVAGENSAANSHVVVAGNSYFATDQNYAAYGNSALLLNSIDWTAGQNNLVNLNPKTPTQRVMVIPAVITMGLILFGSIFLLPGIVAVGGIATWIQRRRRG